MDFNNLNDYYNKYGSANTTSSVGNAIPYTGQQLGQLQQFIQGAQKMPDGTKPVVVCRGVTTEAKDMDDAQRIAEGEAHTKSADAYILKPVRRISPKREVTSTDLS